MKAEGLLYQRIGIGHKLGRGDRIDFMNNKLFVYGILKSGFGLDLENYGGTFLNDDEVNGRLYLIGGAGVGLRLYDKPIPKHIRAKGEIYEVPEKLWEWLDMIENNGSTYTRKIVKTLSGVEAWVYEHTYYDKDIRMYGTHYPVIRDGWFRGTASDTGGRK